MAVDPLIRTLDAEIADLKEEVDVQKLMVLAAKECGEHTDGILGVLEVRRLTVERDNLKEKLASADADAAAMRLGLKNIRDSELTRHVQKLLPDVDVKAPINEGLDGTAGQALLDRLARYREALRYYANEDNWSAFVMDGGDQARAALREGGK